MYMLKIICWCVAIYANKTVKEIPGSKSLL